jgi:hypothetical protein
LHFKIPCPDVSGPQGALISLFVKADERRKRNDKKRTKRKGKEFRNKTQDMDEERRSHPLDSNC